MDRVSTVIPQMMLDFGMIQDEDIDVVRYGLELFLIKISHYCGIFLLAFLLAGVKGLLIMLVFILPYVYLRSITGGYHSKTKKGCLIISILMTVFIVINYELLDNIKINLISLIASIYIYIKCPIENENAPLSFEEIISLRKKIIWALLILNMFTIILMFNDLTLFSNLINISIIFDALLVLFDKFKRYKAYSYIQ